MVNMVNAPIMEVGTQPTPFHQGRVRLAKVGSNSTLVCHMIVESRRARQPFARLAQLAGGASGAAALVETLNVSS